jgi:hypothetical protein
LRRLSAFSLHQTQADNWPCSGGSRLKRMDDSDAAGRCVFGDHRGWGAGLGRHAPGFRIWDACYHPICFISGLQVRVAGTRPLGIVKIRRRRKAGSGLRANRADSLQEPPQGQLRYHSNACVSEYGVIMMLVTVPASFPRSDRGRRRAGPGLVTRQQGADHRPGPDRVESHSRPTPWRGATPVHTAS